MNPCESCESLPLQLPLVALLLQARAELHSAPRSLPRHNALLLATIGRQSKCIAALLQEGCAARLGLGVGLGLGLVEPL